MKTEIRIRKYALMSLLVILILLSVSIALITYRYYGVVARGVLGLAMFNLSIYASQMAKTGSTDHDVLPLWPGDQ